MTYDNSAAKAKFRNVDALADRFLAWPLPESVRSDLCVTQATPYSRSGTNLLTADEARQMIEYLLADDGAFDKSTIPEGYILVPIVLPPGIVTQATPAVEVLDKPGNMVERCWRLLISALQAKGY